MIFILLFIEIILTIVSFKLHDNDIMSPPVVLCLFYFGSNLLGALNYKRYELFLHYNTLLLVAGSLLVFVVVSVVCKGIIQNQKKQNKQCHFINSDSLIHYSNVLLIIILMIQFYGINWQIEWVRNIIAGNQAWSDMMFEYRNTNSSYTLDAVARPWLLENIQVLSQAATYIYAYIFSNNYYYFKKDKIKAIKELRLFIPLILYTAMVFLNAGRGAALEVIMQVLVLFYLLNQKHYKWSKKYSYAFAVEMILFIVLVLIGFSASRFMVGRLNTLDTFEYISQYAGSAIKNLDLFMQDNTMVPSIWGEETFGAIHNQLASLLGMSSLLMSMVYRNMGRQTIFI